MNELSAIEAGGLSFGSLNGFLFSLCLPPFKAPGPGMQLTEDSQQWQINLINLFTAIPFGRRRMVVLL